MSFSYEDGTKYLFTRPSDDKFIEGLREFYAKRPVDEQEAENEKAVKDCKLYFTTESYKEGETETYGYHYCCTMHKQCPSFLLTGWGILVLILIILLCLAGAAAAFWFFYYKRKMGGREEDDTSNSSSVEEP
ncbi:hypothetical protein CRE_14690 [Caenorhabditis remanei]|uniref:Uncharacterized protein n=1 Tax=Caenorhabditis remanei TaxID=31234 RepID=E3M9L3_CAERE|nr:hypothetical protein CRE_14690 [Caenorhabditis remanei]